MVKTDDYENLIPFDKENPSKFALRESEYNANKLFSKTDANLVISIATIGVCGRRIIQNSNNNNLSKILDLFSGRRHTLLSSISIISRKTNNIKSLLCSTKIKIKRLTIREKLLILKEEKALFYLDNSLCESFITWIQGSYSNLKGSYEYELSNILLSSGYYL